MSVIVPNFMQIGHAIAEIWPFIDFFKDGGRPRFLVCYTPVWTTYKEYLVVFVTVQNLVGIRAVVSIICMF